MSNQTPRAKRVHVAASNIHYTLTFEPDFKTFKFAGKLQAQFEPKGKTKELVLNAAELKIKKCWVVNKGKTQSANFKLDDKKEELTIKIKEKISGPSELNIDFEGTHNDRLVGFYRSKYTDIKGKERWLVTTQFEAADARRAFPCWDEPAAKATFDVTIITDKGLTAISNMPVIEKKKQGKKIAWHFDKTPVMSTYLLYLGVGDFESISGKLGKAKINIVTTRGKRQQGKLALEFTKQFLRFFENYFHIKYPLPKLDMIAIPDFASGAMENWGAITFRENILLFDPKSSATATKQYIAEVIAHELAHQWFGNLVTMKWWNDLWLNESFATFMATKASDKLYPDWELWDQFILESFNEGFALDALKSSHPIDVKVENPAQVREIFDDISYDKGGSVLRMLEDFVGEEKFRAGLKQYLTKHKYANATTEDLWSHIGTAAKKPVREIMNSWVKQVGYPLVEAKAAGGKLILTQKRFMLEPGGKDKHAWMIPLSVQADGKTISKIMSKPQEELALSPDTFVKLNTGAKGFYRVKYDNINLGHLKKAVAEKNFSNADRWQIQNDMFALVLSGEVPVKKYLELIESYHDDSAYLVASDVASSLYYLYILSFGEPFDGLIKESARAFYKKLFARLGWEPRKGERHTDTLLRGFAIGVLGRLGDAEIISEAKQRFEKFLKQPNTLHPDIRAAVYSLVAWSGDEGTHKQLTELYKKAPTEEERLRFLSSLSSFRDEKLLLKTLDFALSKDVRVSNLAAPIVRTSGNPYGKKILWPWFKKNWPTIAKRFGAGSPLVGRIISSLSMIDAAHEKEIAQLFKKYHLPGTDMKVAQTLERIRINARLLARMRTEFS